MGVGSSGRANQWIMPIQVEVGRMVSTDTQVVKEPGLGIVLHADAASRGAERVIWEYTRRLEGLGGI